MSNNEKEQVNQLENVFDTIFSETVVTIFLWVLAIYFVMNSTINVSKSDGKNVYTKIVNVVVILIIFAYVFNSYYDLTKEQRENYATHLNETLKTKLQNSNSLLEIGLFGLILYGLAFIIRLMTGDSENPTSINVLMSLTVIVFLISVTIVFIREILNIPIIDILFGSFGKLVSTDENETDNSSATIEGDENDDKEVYNVSNNLYSYDDAPYVCKALGGRLATYDEVEKSYNNGGEWCNYGWTADQMALFPTQKETWNELQTNEDYKHACGRPGVNGGFIANPNIKYGVNCYGKKPRPTEMEEKMLEAKKDSVVPRSREQVKMDRRVEFWKENAEKLLNINSFNKDKWSRY